MMEALVCHPLGMLCIAPQTIEDPMADNVFLDTIKVRMQLSRRARAPGVCYSFVF